MEEESLSLVCRLYGKLHLPNRLRILARMLILIATQKQDKNSFAKSVLLDIKCAILHLLKRTNVRIMRKDDLIDTRKSAPS